MNFDSRKLTRLMWSLVLATAVAGAVTVVAERSNSAPIDAGARLQALGPALFVEVRPAVGDPVVFRLIDGVVVRDVFRLARLPIPEGPEGGQRVTSGQTLAMGADGRVTVGSMDGVRMLALGLRIPLNSATVTDLAAIPGIGESTALAVVARRDEVRGFSSLKDLEGTPGVGPRARDVLASFTSL